ncbi:MAG: chromate efflux transporter [Limnobacter sp.]|uniref:chromate efflux transporter n=1 Tax=Limnobacter sp. TaxID=2003368 RepID=UPI00391925EB
MHAPTQAPTQISFTQALLFWLKLGFISFGGPAGQIAIMHQELVDRRRWISESRFLHALNFCNILPGPEAQQLATYIGWLLHGRWGGFAAGVLFVLPSLFIISGLAWLYLNHIQSPWVAAVFYALKPAVCAVVLHAVQRIGGRVLKTKLLWGIALLSFLAFSGLGVPFPWILLVTALLGWVLGRQRPAWFNMGPAHIQRQSADHAPAVIDDHTATPPHAQFSWARTIRTAAIGLVLWAAPLVALGVLLGWANPLTHMARFFTQAALLTFGGAYAVLPYVFHAAVEQFQWLNATQMLDGLALGESTPGPLIMIVTFVGFLGAWQQQALGADHQVLAALLGAVTATWFTFLPSFLFIFLGGPVIEGARQQINLTAPLTAMSCALVGMILNLALFFTGHVVWPSGLADFNASTFMTGIDWTALAILLLALTALIRFKRGVLELMAASALLGLALHALG